MLLVLADFDCLVGRTSVARAASTRNSVTGTGIGTGVTITA